MKSLTIKNRATFQLNIAEKIAQAVRVLNALRPVVGSFCFMFGIALCTGVDQNPAQAIPAVLFIFCAAALFGTFNEESHDNNE